MKTGIRGSVIKLTFVLALKLSSASFGNAQTPTQSFGRLQSTIRIGEKVEVLDSAGRKTEGKFDGVSGPSLGVIAAGRRQEFVESQIRQITKRRPESRWDGVLIGLGIGALVGAVDIKSVCARASEPDDCFTVGWGIVLPIFAGGGAGVGALIDFAIKKREVVFAPAVDPGYRIKLHTVRDKGRKGIEVFISF